MVYYGDSLGREAAKFNEDGRTITKEDKWPRWSASRETTPEMIQAIRLVSERERKRPNSIDGLVAQSHVIVLGTITSVLGERMIGGYGEDGKPTPVGEEGELPYTDYEARIGSVLKGDGALEDGGTLVLRMFGHRTQRTDVVTSVAVQQPEPDSYYMFVLDQNLDGTYGSGLERLINVDGDHVTFADGLGFYTEFTGAEFVEAVRQEAGGKDLTEKGITPAPTEASAGAKRAGGGVLGRW